MADQDFYATQSAITGPGPWAERLDALPGDLRALKDAANQLVFHYRADGDWTEHGIAPERITEIDTRYADRMFARIFALSDAPLGASRRANQRLVGCCRDFTVFFIALCRHKGIPARERVGFAAYFDPGWKVDHVVAEVWDENERRWRLVDAELGDGFVDATDGTTLDPLDLPRDRFLVGSEAWRMARAGEADAARFVVAPDLDIPQTRGWPYLLHNLVHDLAAMNKEEMILWDAWGLMDSDDPLTTAQLAMLDETARVMNAPEPSVAELRRLYERDELRVPEVVTSYTSVVENPPVRVRLASHTAARQAS